MIRSRRCKEFDSIRDLIEDTRLHAVLRHRRRPRPFCTIIDGRLWRGTASLHRTPEARRWRTCLRIKRLVRGIA